MRSTIRKFVAVLAAGCSLFAACRSSVPNQVLTKPAPVSAPPPVVRTGGPWVYRPSTQRQAFVVDQRATLTILTDTISRTDSLASHAELTFVAVLASGGVSGTVGVFVVQNPGREAATPAGLVLPFPFRADFSAHGTQLDFTAPREAAPCASNALAVAQSLRDLWFRPPDTLRVGATWQDSASYVVCRDGIPLHAAAHRVFRIVRAAERDGRVLLSISRSAHTTIEGSGAQFGEAVSVRGSGGGELVYTLDAASGEIVSATGGSMLDLSLRSRLRTQAVRQTAEIRIGRS